MIDVLNRRRFLATSAGLAAGALIGCQQSGKFSGGISPESSTTFYGDTFDTFATALYGELRKKDGNVFFSPYSISTALAMTAAGARGNTLSQMQKVLGLPPDKPVIDALATKGKAVTLGGNRGYELNTANALWPQTGYGWSPEYLKQVTETFQASVTETDYAANPEAARQRINKWVEKQTRDKIKDLLAQGSIDRLTRMVLTNAIYFKSDWFKAFKENLTQNAAFTLLDGTKKNVQLMHRQENTYYFQDEQLQVIKLPYKSTDISFIAVLPIRPEKFSDLDSNTSFADYGKWSKQFQSEDVILWLPKFKIESNVQLNAPLIKAGMTDAFVEKVADFSGMTNGPNELYISIVIHKAYVDVNEEGTEAAAATAVAGVQAVSEVIPRKPKIFRADRPFLFALRHEPTGTILFMGRYSNPT